MLPRVFTPTKTLKHVYFESPERVMRDQPSRKLNDRKEYIATPHNLTANDCEGKSRRSRDLKNGPLLALTCRSH